MKYKEKQISFELASKIKYIAGLHSFIWLRKLASHETDTPIFFLYYPLTRMMKNKLMALFNMEGTRNKASFRKTNLMKIPMHTALGECMSYAVALQ